MRAVRTAWSLPSSTVFIAERDFCAMAWMCVMCSFPSAVMLPILSHQRIVAPVVRSGPVLRTRSGASPPASPLASPLTSPFLPTSLHPAPSRLPGGPVRAQETAVLSGSQRRCRRRAHRSRHAEHACTTTFLHLSDLRKQCSAGQKHRQYGIMWRQVEYSGSHRSPQGIRRGWGTVFLGTHMQRLDDKGRLILPAKFREEL